MARKQTVEGGKKNEIIEAALHLFLQNGYEGTSIRMIQKQVGSEVGLFYYYFKNKDELFGHVLDRFFYHYKEDFASIVENGRRNPCRVMTDFFEYVERETEAFREKYEGNIHRTIRWVIREQTLCVIEPYLQEVVKIQSEYYGVEPPLSLETTAVYLTHGVGSYILHESRERYLSQKKDVVKGVSLLMGMSEEEQELRIPHWANKEDKEGFMILLEEVKEFYPDLKVQQFKKDLKEHIKQGEGLVYRYKEKVIAGLIFSKKEKALQFLAVHPNYRKKGLAKRLLETMYAQFPKGVEIKGIGI